MRIRNIRQLLLRERDHGVRHVDAIHVREIRSHVADQPSGSASYFERPPLSAVRVGDLGEGGFGACDLVGVADDQGEFGEQACEGVAGLAVGGALRRGFPFRCWRALRLGDRVGV